MYIVNFKNLKKQNVDIAGGKGASLGEMINNKIPVPNGFVVLSKAFEEFIEESRIQKEIVNILSSLNINDVDSIENGSENIIKLISENEISSCIEDQILNQFKKLNTKYVAVRSSATAEDGLENAWAGQLESYLNTTEENLLKNVKRCWVSLFTPRAIFYRLEKGLHKENISVAVVVQKMVNSEKSGIAFSIHPVTQDQNQIIIEAGFGLGESIVSGQITPDNYVIDKRDDKILEINVNNQIKGLFRRQRKNQRRKSQWVTLGEKGREQTLNEEEMLKVSKLVKEIESHYKVPQDIEWACEGNNFFIVQSRPITTVTEQIQEYRKIMTRPINLIDCEIWDKSERINLFEDFKKLIFFDPLFIYTPDKSVDVYYNFTDPNQDLQPLIDFLEKNLTWLNEIKKEFDSNCDHIRRMIRSEANDYFELYKAIRKIWPVITVANSLGCSEYFKVSGKLMKIFVAIRNESDDVLHPAINYLSKLLSNKISKKKDIDQILFCEFKKNMPTDSELKRRRNGWLYHKGKVTCDIESYLKNNRIRIINPLEDSSDQDCITGNVACRGISRGKVKIIFNLSDLKNIEEGDILVTPMTVPEMIPMLKKVSGIVTNEGGLTCHAAIVSREMNKPCIIGTVNATSVLSNGDFVEVDADEGVVRVLKK